MIDLLMIICLVFPQDSLSKDSVQSIMFKQAFNQPALERYLYRHEQGFFCDFEDQINKGRKLKLNLGVGDQ